MSQISTEDTCFFSSTDTKKQFLKRVSIPTALFCHLILFLLEKVAVTVMILSVSLPLKKLELKLYLIDFICILNSNDCVFCCMDTNFPEHCPWKDVTHFNVVFILIMMESFCINIHIHHTLKASFLFWAPYVGVIWEWYPQTLINAW